MHDDPTTFPRLEARTQRFTLGTPRAFTVAPDGFRVLFLRSPSGVDKRQALYVLDTATGTERCLVDPAALGGEERLSTTERAARERSRTRSAGVVAFSCDDAVSVAVFVLSGVLYAVDVATGALTELPAAPAVIDPRIDPTGTRVAYVADGALRVIEADGSGDRTVVAPDGELVTWGLAEFVAAEEMDRGRGYWWSPEGTRLLAARVDNAGVPVWHIADPADPAAAPRSVAYPAAGQRNAEVRLALFDAAPSSTVDSANPKAPGLPVEWDREAFPYLVNAHWSAAGPPLLVVQSRDQRTQPILSVDAATGVTSTLHTETDEHWVDVYTGLPAWTPSGALVHGGVRDGAYRLLVDGADVSGASGTDASGSAVQLRQVVSVGADGVLFTASAADPSQVHLYFLPHGGTPARVSDVDGVQHGATGGGVTVLAAWSLDWSGPRVRVLRDGAELAVVESRHEPAPFTPDVELLTLGERSLRAALLLPSGHRPGTPLPVIMEPYGGPHAQLVLQSSNAYLGRRWLAEQGFAVLVVDGRGTPGRGPAWDRALAYNLGVTLDDQVDALHAAARQYPDLDLSRVAIRGWSYGGYLSAMAVLRRPDVFRAAVAGAPVIDWRLYDTFYTERYLGHPDENPEVYERNSLLADAGGLRRPLLLIHGLADDNVFSAHTLRMSAALLAAGRRHEVWPLTGVTHMLPADGDMAVNFPLVQLEWLRAALDVPVPGEPAR